MKCFIQLVKLYSPKENQWFGILRTAPCFHFYIIQAVSFIYILYRLTSRNYAIYGYLPESAFVFPEIYNMQTWYFLSKPISHWLNLNFLYDYLGHPGYEFLLTIQVVGIAIAICGLIGFLPKQAALLCFIIKIHLTGLLQSTNANIDGGSLCMAVLLILSVSPSKCFYSLTRKSTKPKRHVDYHWPIFLLLLVVGCFYSYAGINKIVHVGLFWPFSLHLENLIFTGLEDSIFYSSRFVAPEITSLLGSPHLSTLAGIVTLLGEISFVGILFYSKLRLPCILLMISMHVLVYYSAGINFIGSSIILFLCLDWNSLVRNGMVYYNSSSETTTKLVRTLQKLNFHKRLRFSDLKSTIDEQHHSSQLIFVDENGFTHKNMDALEQICHRCPALYPIAAILKFPGIKFFSHKFTLKYN